MTTEHCLKISSGCNIIKKLSSCKNHLNGGRQQLRRWSFLFAEEGFCASKSWQQHLIRACLVLGPVTRTKAVETQSSITEMREGRKVRTKKERYSCNTKLLEL